MKTIMITTIGTVALGAMTIKSEVPKPVIVTPVAAEAAAEPVQVEMPVAAIAHAGEELAKGAVCKVYYNPRWTAAMFDGNGGRELVEWVESAVAVDQGYDDKATRFDAKNISKHKPVNIIAVPKSP